MKNSVFVLCLLSSIATIALSTESRGEVIPIDLTNFFADPSVTVSPDGFSAVLNEDAEIAPVILSNDPSAGDPGLGDPAIIFGGPIAVLSFDYDFREAQGENDEFLAFVLNAQGDSAGAGFEFFAQDPSAGTAMFDIMPLAAEQELGLQFQLGSFDTTFGSSVSISNVHVVTPEPGSLSLFAIVGIVIVFVVRTHAKRRSHRNDTFSSSKSVTND